MPIVTILLKLVPAIQRPFIKHEPHLSSFMQSEISGRGGTNGEMGLEYLRGSYAFKSTGCLAQRFQRWSYGGFGYLPGNEPLLVNTVLIKVVNENSNWGIG